MKARPINAIPTKSTVQPQGKAILSKLTSQAKPDQTKIVAVLGPPPFPTKQFALSETGLLFLSSVETAPSIASKTVNDLSEQKDEEMMKEGLRITLIKYLTRRRTTSRQTMRDFNKMIDYVLRFEAVPHLVAEVFQEFINSGGGQFIINIMKDERISELLSNEKIEFKQTEIEPYQQKDLRSLSQPSVKALNLSAKLTSNFMWGALLMLFSSNSSLTLHLILLLQTYTLFKHFAFRPAGLQVRKFLNAQNAGFSPTGDLRLPEKHCQPSALLESNRKTKPF